MHLRMLFIRKMVHYLIQSSKLKLSDCSAYNTSIFMKWEGRRAAHLLTKRNNQDIGEVHLEKGS